MKSRVSVSGLRELDAALGELSKSTARNVLRRVLLKAGQPMADAAMRLAPDDPNGGTPDLHTGIVVSAKLKNTVGNAEYSSVLAGGGSKAEAVGAMRDARRAAGGEGSFAEVYVGPLAELFYAHFPEFGTTTQAAQPYMRPAFDQEKGRVVEIIKTELSAEIAKAAARAARRAAKKAGGK